MVFSDKHLSLSKFSSFIYLFSNTKQLAVGPNTLNKPSFSVVKHLKGGVDGGE